MLKTYKDKAIEYEKKRQFDRDLNDHRYDDALPIDGDYNYLPVKAGERIRRFFLVPAISFFGWVVGKFGFGLKIKGKKNLKSIKKSGAIAICNHVHELDTLFVKISLGGFRTFHTGSFYLLKRGWAGRIFKSGGFLPVGETVKDLQKLSETVDILLKKGKIINFYPEHALWFRYEKIRPFKLGAFRFAAKANVPVLPVFIEFRETALRKFFKMQKKIVLHILTPEYPELQGGLKQRAEKLRDTVFKKMKDKYESVYNREMVYLPEEPDESGCELQIIAEEN